MHLYSNLQLNLAQPKLPKFPIASHLFLIVLIGTVLSADAQWMQTGGPEGGYTEDILEIGPVILVSAGNGGVYRSQNNGAEWELAVNGLPCQPSIMALDTDGVNVYAAIYGNGIYRSDDEGLNWYPANMGAEGTTFYNIAVNGSQIYGGEANGGVYYSPDGGNSWFDRSTGIENIQFQDFEFYNGKVYAGGSNLYETSDNGLSWQLIAVSGLGPNGVRSMTTDQTSLFVGDDDTVFYAQGNLTNWSPTPVSTSATIISMKYSGGTVFATTSFGRYFYSTDGGNSWTQRQNNLPELNNGFAIRVQPLASGKILMSSAVGLFASEDSGFTWQTTQNGLKAVQIRSLNEGQTYIYAGTEQNGMYRSPDNGMSWEIINNGLDSLNSWTIYEIVNLGNQIIIATGGGIYESIDNGTNWVRKFDPGLNFSTAVLAYDSGLWVTAVNGRGIYVSVDGTNSWTLASTTGLDINTGYSAIAVEGNTIVVGTLNGEVYISENGNNFWDRKNISQSFTVANNLYFIDGILYAAATSGLWTTNNLGDSWSTFNNITTYISDIRIANNLLYGATANGVIVTDMDEPGSFELCEGMGNMEATALLVSGNSLYAGTFAYSVWVHELLTTIPDTNQGSNFLSSLELCPTDGLIDLNQFLPQGTAGGFWIPSLHSGGSVFDPDIDLGGLYTYSTGTGCECSEDYLLEIQLGNRADAGVSSRTIICELSQSINLLDLLDGTPQAGGSWSPQLSGNDSYFNPLVDQGGVYTYTVQNMCGSDSSEIEVSILRSYPLEDNQVQISSSINSNSILIKLLVDSPFEYSLDGVNFQESNILVPTEGGEIMVYGREIDGCAYFEASIKLFVLPKFFTPNGDMVNDNWVISGDSSQQFRLEIFDRYGKLLKQLNTTNSSWDGTFNGKPMPASDYWYHLSFENSGSKRGHFSLIR